MSLAPYILLNQGSGWAPIGFEEDRTEADTVARVEDLLARFRQLQSDGWLVEETRWMIGRDLDDQRPMVLYRVAFEP